MTLIGHPGFLLQWTDFSGHAVKSTVSAAPGCSQYTFRYVSPVRKGRLSTDGRP